MATETERIKAKLKRRQETAVVTREQKGLGKKTILDWSKYPHEKPLTFKPRTGKDKNLIDIIPFRVTQEWMRNLRAPTGKTLDHEIGDWEYKLELPVHKNVGLNNDTVICHLNAFGNKCPICDDMFEEYNKDNVDKDKVSQLRASWRDWFNVYNYDAEENPDDLRIWEDMSYYNFEKNVMDEAQLDDHIITYTDLTEGKSIEFKGVEKKLGQNPFTEAQSIEFLDRDPYEDSIVDDTVSFDALAILMTYEEILKLHTAVEEDDDSPSTEETKTSEETKTTDQTKTTSSSRSRGRTKKEEEKPKEDDIPKDGEFKCSMGLRFGTDYLATGKEECQKCPEDEFALCEKKHEELVSKPEPKPEPEPEKPKRTRQRGSKPEEKEESTQRTTTRRSTTRRK